MDYREKAKQIHESVNHTYDGYNYVLHLDAVEAVHQEFKNELDIIPKDCIESNITGACYFHDIEEDTRWTHNDIKKEVGIFIAEIVHAVTNEKGRTRAERANDKYYEGIRNTTGASFVKMCDRIANVRYSKLMGSSMFEKYRKENKEFMEKVDAKRFPKMSECLIRLFE